MRPAARAGAIALRACTGVSFGVRDLYSFSTFSMDSAPQLGEPSPSALVAAWLAPGAR